MGFLVGGGGWAEGGRGASVGGACRATGAPLLKCAAAAPVQGRNSWKSGMCCGPRCKGCLSGKPLPGLGPGAQGENPWTGREAKGVWPKAERFLSEAREVGWGEEEAE